MKKCLLLLPCTVITCAISFAQKDSTAYFAELSRIEDKINSDTKVIIVSPQELQDRVNYCEQRVKLFEELAAKNGWAIITPPPPPPNPYGTLNEKDVSNFKTLPETKLVTLYTLDILRRFAESLKLSTLGTKAVLVKAIKAKVLSIG